MMWLGWGLFAFAAFMYIGGMRLSHNKRQNLTEYIVYLLLSDETHNHHKNEFKKWIRNFKAKDAQALFIGSGFIIEAMADNLAKNAPLGAAAILWNSEENKEMREK